MIIELNENDDTENTLHYTQRSRIEPEPSDAGDTGSILVDEEGDVEKFILERF